MPALHIRLDSALRVMGLARGRVGGPGCAEWPEFCPSRDETWNWNSAVLGLLLALLLPVNAPWWLVVIGCVLTIVIGKRLFGGWGAYPVHPVALGYAMLAVSWPERLDRTASMVWAPWETTMVEPLRLVKTLGAGRGDRLRQAGSAAGPPGGRRRQRHGAVAGAGRMLLLLVGRSPGRCPWGSWLGCSAAPGCWAGRLRAARLRRCFSCWRAAPMLAAFFLAPEHTTSPVNPWPMLIYGLLGGVLLVLIRTFSIHVDGAVFAVLLVNLCAPAAGPHRPRPCGSGGGGAMREIGRLVLVLVLICVAQRRRPCPGCETALASRIEQQSDFYVRGPALERLFERPARRTAGQQGHVASRRRIDYPGLLHSWRRRGDRAGRGGRRATAATPGTSCIMIGLDLASDAMLGVEIVSHSETPGVGAQVEKTAFRQQWRGLPSAASRRRCARGGQHRCHHRGDLLLPRHGRRHQPGGRSDAASTRTRSWR